MQETVMYVHLHAILIVIFWDEFVQLYHIFFSAKWCFILTRQDRGFVIILYKIGGPLC